MPSEPIRPAVRGDLRQQRREYDNPPLIDDQLPADPYLLFESWYQQATQDGLLESNALVLATCGADGRPTQRTVLLKYYDAGGFVFFTNLSSRKAAQIASNPFVSLHFLWLPLQRQVEIAGQARRVSATESLKYFTMRPRGSQLGAWVSEQSSVITSRSLLDAKLAELKKKFANREVPLPSFWGGFRVVPDRFEFWQGQPNRLHDRFAYQRDGDAPWQRHRLAP